MHRLLVIILGCFRSNHVALISIFVFEFDYAWVEAMFSPVLKGEI